MKKLLSILMLLVAIVTGAQGALTSTHSPGVYTKSADEGGYGQTLKTVSERDYEIYGFSSTNSDKNYIWAGTTTTSSTAANCVLSFATTTVKENGWISNAVNGRGSSYSNLSASGTEFNGIGGYQMNYRSNSTLTLKISGYDQFSIWAKDGNTNDKHFVVTIDGTEQDMTLSTSATVRRFDVTTEEHTIVVSATGTSNNVLWGFSLRLPAGPVDPTFALSSEEVEVGKTISVNGPAGLSFNAEPVSGTTGAVSVSGGTITGVTAGAAQVRVTSTATSKYKAYDHTFDITVTAAKIATELSFGTPTTTVARGEEVTNAATLTAGGETISGTIDYSSDDETIATVDATGKVTGKKAGTTSIKANYAGDATYSAAEEVSYNITVTLPALTPVSNKTWTVKDAALLEAYPVDSKTTSQSITATNVVDNMEIVATSAKAMNMAYNKNAATHDDLPSGLTYRFQTLGNPGTNNDTRYLHFKAVANSKVSAYFIRGTEGVNVAGYSLGTLDSANPTGTYTNPGGSVDKMVFTTGDTETDVYLYSVSDDGTRGVQFIAVKVEPIQSQNVTVGDTGFATIGLPFATTVPAGVTAYAVESVNDSKVQMSAAIPDGTTIPANKGFVIVAAKNTYTFTEVATAEYEGTDILEAVGATPKAATTEAPIYVLTITDAQKKKIGFKKATSGSLGAYKAYLPGTVSTQTSLSVSFDEETAINGIAESEANAEAPVKVIKNGKLFIGNYNVAGQQVK